MTAVNWERLSGEHTEQLACTLILQSNRNGNRVTPSQGDGGIDFLIRASDGSNRWDVYQVKRFTGRLKSADLRKIKDSWDVFLGSADLSSIASWTLVVPTDPSRERLDWPANLTAASGINTHWLGRTQLDALAAAQPHVVDYFQGDGGRRITTLLSQAFDAKQTIAGDCGETVLKAVGERAANLATALDNLDPFYRYQIEIRHGQITPGWEPPESDQVNAAFVSYEQIDAQRYRAVRVIPRSAYSMVLSPIEGRITFDVSDPTVRDQVQDFERYGAPFELLPATVERTTGPIGTAAGRTSHALVSFRASSTGAIPDLEIRAVDSAGKVVCRLPLDAPTVSSGWSGEGGWILGSDPSESLHIEVRMGHPDGRDNLKMNLSPIGGKSVRRVRPVTDFVEALEKHGRLEVALDGGRSLGGCWEIPPGDFGESHTWAPYLRDLEVIQAHAAVVVAVPNGLDSETMSRITRAATLLRGEPLAVTNESVSLVPREDVEPPSGPRAIYYHRPMVFELADQTIELDRFELVYCPSARFERRADGPVMVFDTPATLSAVNASMLGR